jgi:hypothetical protein
MLKAVPGNLLTISLWNQALAGRNPILKSSAVSRCGRLFYFTLFLGLVNRLRGFFKSVPFLSTA